MKAIAWNLNHRTIQKRIPPQLAAAVASLNPDLVVLTEYVPGPSRAPFLTELAQRGFSHLRASDYVKGQNSVLIVSRTPLSLGGIKAPALAPAMPPNILHVQMPAFGIEVLGMRMPDFSTVLPLKRVAWDWIEQTADTLRSRPALIIGDLNTDPAYPIGKCGDRIQRLGDRGWQIASPAEGASYWTLNGKGVRIDHGFVTHHLTIVSKRYVAAENGFIFAGKAPGALSDHAVLEVTLRACAGPPIKTG
jgi:endonuclease/exonuclease/phosphatase family metal-dependent hydrolase